MRTVIWLTPVAVPLATALAVALAGRRIGWLIPVAPLPALALGVLGDTGAGPELPWVLPGVQLGLDGPGRALLIAAATLWIAAAIYALRAPGVARGFGPLFLLTMAGNLGLLLADDAVSLYVFFALMTVAGYGLVVHDRSEFALRAGRVYIALAIVGELAVFTGLALSVSAAGSLDLAELGPAIAVSPHRDLTVGLVLAGFGAKAGIVPLHLWLPLAHPAAPVPASAVLSGAMIKAGLVGWIRVLPLGDAGLAGWSSLLMAAGLASIVLGVVAGTTQRQPKVTLAYSSISQMGVLAVLVGVGLRDPEAAPLAVAAAALYAMHHGFAKGALFLGVGVLGAESRVPWRRVHLLGAGLAAVALAGGPLTSGALGKLAVKDTVSFLPQDSAWALTVALSLGAAGTTVLMARVVILVARPQGEGTAAPAAVVVPWFAVLGAVLAVPWLVQATLLDDLARPALTPGSLWDGLWPIALGLAAVAAAWILGRCRSSTLGQIPPGDVVVGIERLAHALGSGWTRTIAPAAAGMGALMRAVQEAAYLAVQPGRSVDLFDRRMTRWRAGGLLFVLLGAALVLAAVTAAG